MRGLALLLLLLLVPTAAGHASAVRTDPPQLTGLAQPPEYISIEYSEELDFDDSSIGIYDDKLLRRDAGDAYVDPENPRVVKVYTGNLIRGVYTVGYEMRSAADGHLEKGSIPLTIGVPCTSCLEAQTSMSFDARGTPWVESWTVALGYLALVVTAGAVAVARIVPPGPARLRAEAVLIFAMAAACVATWARAEQVWRFTNDAAHAGFVLRVAGLAAAAVALLRMQRTGRGWNWVAASVVVAVLAWPLSGHGGRSVQEWGVQSLHLLLLAPWAGGLMTLLALWRWLDPADVRPVMLRFSRMAMAGVGGLLVTGIPLALVRLQTLSDLWRSGYGQVMLLKILLVLIVLAGGAANHRRLWNGRRPRRWSAGAPKSTRRMMRLEAVGVVAVLAVTGVLGVQPVPADRPIPPAPYTNQGWWGDYHVRLEISPTAADGTLAVGDHRHKARILDRQGDPVTGAAVAFEIRHQILDIGVMRQPAEELGDGWYTVAGSFLGGLGVWEEKVVWHPPGAQREYWGLFEVDLGDIGHFHGGSKVTDPHFDTGYLAAGASYSRHFTTRDVGYFLYHCHPHQWMVASIVVDPNATQQDHVVVEIYGNASDSQGGMYFGSTEVRVAPGTTVEWINRGDVPHSATNVRWYELDDPARPDREGAA